MQEMYRITDRINNTVECNPFTINTAGQKHYLLRMGRGCGVGMAIYPLLHGAAR